MLRVLSTAACVLLLAGCVSTPSYRYYGERTYSDGYGGQVVAVESDRYVGYAAPAPVWYDYPAYYSVFWSLNRSYVDPYFHPGFYYGVTWFPRNYYSSIYRSWHGPGWYTSGFGRPFSLHLAYSPYRYAWVDNYYDWYPWYSAYPRYTRYYAPRYGNPRNETERLSQYSRAFRGDGLPGSDVSRLSAFSRAAYSQARVDARREAYRGADYGSRGGRGRADPGVTGFSQDSSARRADTVRRAPTSGRQDPDVSGFRGPDYGNSPRALPPRSAPGQSRRLDEQGVAYPYRESSSASRPSVERREVGVRVDPRAPTPTANRNADLGSAPRYSNEGSVRAPRRSEVYTPRDAGQRADPAPRYESATPVRQAPAREAPRYQRSEVPAREAPVYQAPRQATRAEPRYEAPRAEPRYSAPRAEPRYQAPRPEPRYEAPRAEPRERAEPEPRAEPRQSARSRDEE